MSCKIKNGRYSDRGHKCGTCNKYGHGQIECNDGIMIKKLLYKFGGNILPIDKRCPIEGCSYSWSHSGAAHICSYCSDREHGKYNCPHIEVIWKIKCPVCRKINLVNSKQKVIYGTTINCCCCLEKEANFFSLPLLALLPKKEN